MTKVEFLDRRVTELSKILQGALMVQSELINKINALEEWVADRETKEMERRKREQ